MLISKIRLKNWRNFLSVDVSLRERMFLVGPNACGKSNFLDAIRFLHDVAKPGGGLRRAVEDRGGTSKIRCLAARKKPNIELEIWLQDAADASGPKWRYAMCFRQAQGGQHLPELVHEKVWGSNGDLLVERPDVNDKGDPPRLTQTYLEQVNANTNFREVSHFLESVSYFHIVPQLLRHPEAFSGRSIPEEPFGRDFLEKLAKTPEKTRASRLLRIERFLTVALPFLSDLSYQTDELGMPHLEARYKHWRATEARQREDQFSDGTLRMIGLLWSLLEGESTLLLEEPELSLNAGIVSRLPSIIHRAQRKSRKTARQVILSTHSADLLADKGIAPEEVLLLNPPDGAAREATEVVITADDRQIRALLQRGVSMAEAVIPRTRPPQMAQMELVF